MKNKLENWLANSEYDEVLIMNVLQDWGVISDNCIWAKDCGDDLKAIKWLARNIDFVKKVF